MPSRLMPKRIASAFVDDDRAVSQLAALGILLASAFILVGALAVFVLFNA